MRNSRALKGQKSSKKFWSEIDAVKQLSPFPPMLPRYFFIAVAALSTSLLPAEQAPGGKTIRLLTVGNSFSHNATHYLGDLAKAGGDSLILREDNVGGASLEVHWKKVQAFEHDPSEKLGKYTEGRSLKDDLTHSHWDVVTIQQASILSHDLATYRPFAKELCDYIRNYAPDAVLLLNETLYFRVDYPRFTEKNSKPG
ncbi:MAG: hypothetical protein JWO94_2022 [Verrucomicrobiaceae bacterium]|nr:hypothetical protein [Verrucomicrobiaceae bacterium]